MYHFIYKTTNHLNSKIYLGVHKSKTLNDNYLGSGKALKAAIKKYGKVNFSREILMIFPTYELALKYEKLLVNEDFVQGDDNYNIKIGGYGGVIPGKPNPFLGRKHTEEAKKILSEKASQKVGDKNPFYGRNHSEETKAILSEKASQRTGDKNHFYGKKHTEELKKKFSEARKGVESEAKRKGWWITPFGKFRTYREAAIKSGVSTSCIKNRCRKNSNKPVGYNYMIPEEYHGELTWKERGWYFLEFGEE